MRLDSGNDSQDNFTDLKKSNVEFIVKRNLRKESLDDWAELAQEIGEERVCREGKRVWTGQTNIGVSGKEAPFPITFEVRERTIKKGQYLVTPELEVDTYYSSLPELGPDEVIYLYNDHGTSEQFHSEIKSDMDLERLPSGNFESNSLMLHLGMLSYNMLRIVGQQSLEVIEEVEEHLPRPRRKKVHRRRIRTVLQDLVYIAGRLIKTGRQLFISLGRLNPMAKLWVLLDQRLRRLAVETG